MGIYLDSNATTPLSEEVITSITEACRDGWANPSSQYSDGLLAKKMVTKARNQVKDLIGAKHEKEIVFVSGGTEANNWVFFNILEMERVNNTLKNNGMYYVTNNIDGD